MIQPNYYKKIDQGLISEEVRKEGFHPLCITDAPGHVYTLHRHPETKLLVFLEGEMTVNVGEKSYQCQPGDRLVIAGNVEHSAVVGPRGCVFLWSERLSTSSTESSGG